MKNVLQPRGQITDADEDADAYADTYANATEYSD